MDESAGGPGEQWGKRETTKEARGCAEGVSKKSSRALEEVMTFETCRVRWFGEWLWWEHRRMKIKPR